MHTVLVFEHNPKETSNNEWLYKMLMTIFIFKNKNPSSHQFGIHGSILGCTEYNQEQRSLETRPLFGPKNHGPARRISGPAR
jgi:hypothetical protein